MRTIAFADGFLIPVLEGNKLFTVRKFRQGAHDFSAGEIVIGEFAEGMKIMLQITRGSRIARFKTLLSPKSKLKKIGYYFDKNYFAELARFYPDLTWDTTGAIVFFEVLKVHDEAVAGYLRAR